MVTYLYLLQNQKSFEQLDSKHPHRNLFANSVYINLLQQLILSSFSKEHKALLAVSNLLSIQSQKDKCQLSVSLQTHEVDQHQQNAFFQTNMFYNLNLSNNVQMLELMIKTHQHYRNIQQMKKVVQKSWMLSKDHKLDYYNKNLKRLFQCLLNFLYLGQQPYHSHTLVTLVK